MTHRETHWDWFLREAQRQKTWTLGGTFVDDQDANPNGRIYRLGFHMLLPWWLERFINSQSKPGNLHSNHEGVGTE